MTDIQQRIARLSPEQRRLLEQKLRERTVKQSGIPRRDPHASCPLSFSQQRLWFLDQLEPGSPVYNIPYAVRIDGPLDPAALQRALQKIIERHEILRTQFAAVDGTPTQAATGNTDFRVQVCDVSGLRDEDLQVRLLAAARQPFDLRRDLLLRAHLFRSNAESHVLLIVFHHIASDAWSFSVLFRELAEIYSADIERRAANLAELPIQYADYADWQRKSFSGERLQSQIDWWKTQLTGAEPLQLPTDHTRPAVMTHTGARHTFKIDAAIAGCLRQIGRDSQSSTFMVLMAAYAILLSRYSGQKDIAVGSPIAGRQQIDVEGLIGFFVNTLVFRTDLSGEPTFTQLLTRVRETALGAYARQDVPFEKLVEELQPERNRGQNPIFQAAFALQNTPVSSLKLGDARITPLQMHDGTAKFDLMLMLHETPAGLNAILEYRTDLYTPATIARMAGHFQTLLQSIAANPDAVVAELPILTPPERHELLTEWAGPRPAYPNRPLHVLFEEQVRQRPNAVAVQYEAASLTYTQLNERANKIAHLLRARGVKADDLIGLCIERSLDMVIATLAILKAGGAYLPLDPTYPAERITFMLEDAKAPLLLTLKKHLSSLPRNGANVLCIDDASLGIDAQPKTDLLMTATGDNLAYVIYTSGSTGTPKGICIPQKAVARLVLNTDYCQLASHDRVAQLSNVSFDAATFEIWGALLNGGTLVGITRDIALSPADFVRTLRSERISAMFVTTALFNLLISENPRAFETLTHVLFGGEACDPRRIRECLNAAPPRHLLHVYGPTEVTTFSTWHEIKDVAADAATVPIGRPIANTDALILDAHRQLVPVGVCGEIYLGGDGLARGYLHRPELTAEKFVSHPFEANARLYRSGDIGRFLPSGAIEFIGRVDHQVKIRGFRVELGEIETALLAHPAVKECIVIARVEASGSRNLVGYVVPRQACSGTDIRQSLAAHLPEYMVPSAIVTLDALPLNANGKVDRKALPAPDATQTAVIRERKLPWAPLHQQLIEIWQELLGINNVGINDNFFELGGHSLLAVRMLSRVEQVCGRKVPVSQLYTANTIERLAEALLKESPHDATAPMWFNRGGSQTPLFFMHGDFSGGGLYCVNLARHLGDDQPLVALHPHGTDNAEFEPDIRLMAADHVRTIRSIRPRGPYRIAGFCAGGYVAFEAACQLQRAGEDVERVILIDVAPLNPTAWCVNTLVNFSGTVCSRSKSQRILAYDRWMDRVYRLKEFAAAPFHQQISTVGERLTGKVRRATGRPVNPSQDRSPRQVLTGLQDQTLQLGRAYRWAIGRYRPRNFTGAVTLLCSQDLIRDGMDPARGWRHKASSTGLSHIPGTHLTCITTHSRDLAASMSKALEDEAITKVTASVLPCVS